MLVFTISFGIIFSLVIHGHSLFAPQTNFYQLSREEKIAHNFTVILNVASAAEFKEIVKIYFSFPQVKSSMKVVEKTFPKMLQHTPATVPVLKDELMADRL